MNATVNVLCYKSKVLSNGEHPLMLRICKDGKRKYQSLKLSINPKYWDFEKEKPKRNCPNRELVEKVISTHLEQFRKQIIELKAEEKDYSAQFLLKGQSEKAISKFVGDFYKELLDDMDQADKYGNWRFYRSSYNSVKTFTNGKMDFLFSEIDVLWLNNYEQWLKKRGNKGTTISVQFRTLRATYNKAIESGSVKKKDYPFNEFKICKFDTSTKKRAISKEDITKIKNANLSDTNQIFARDIFMFTFWCGGINFVDIANLKANNVVDGRIAYLRHKTHNLITLQLLPEAKLILERYSQDRANNYLFPILDVKILDNTALFFKIYPRLWTIPDNDYANLHLLQFSVIFLYTWGMEFKSERYPMKLISPFTAFGIYYLIILTCGGSGYIGCWDFSNRVPALIYPVIAIITYELIFEKLLPLLQKYSKTLLQKNTI